jgi:hypothetical protein
MSILKNVIDYARTAMPAEFGDIEVKGRNGEVSAVAEIMRRINYNPDPRDLAESRARWLGKFSEPITEPKQARTRYLNFASDMNGTMMDSLTGALKRRAAGFPPVDWSTALQTAYDPDTFENVTVETDEFRAQQEGVRAAEVNQSIEGVVDRLLEATPLDDERWGRW